MRVMDRILLVLATVCCCLLMPACQNKPSQGRLVQIDWDGGAGSPCFLSFTAPSGGATFVAQTLSLECDPDSAKIGQDYKLRYDVVRNFAAGCMMDVNCPDFQDIEMVVELTPL